MHSMSPCSTLPQLRWMSDDGATSRRNQRRPMGEATTRSKRSSHRGGRSATDSYLRCLMLRSLDNSSRYPMRRYFAA